MIADTTFLSDWTREHQRCEVGPARRKLAELRRTPLRTTIISAGELAVLFASATQCWEWLSGWKILRLHPGVAAAAADIDRRLKGTGQRIGENDNWIAGFALAYHEPLLTRDGDFARVTEIRLERYPAPAG